MSFGTVKMAKNERAVRKKGRDPTVASTKIYCNPLINEKEIFQNIYTYVFTIHT